MSKAIAVERQSTGSADADGHPSTPRSTNPKSPKNPTDVPRQSKLLPTRRPPLMIKPHGRLVSSSLTRQSHPDCRATGFSTLGGYQTLMSALVLGGAVCFAGAPEDVL